MPLGVLACPVARQAVAFCIVNRQTFDEVNGLVSVWASIPAALSDVVLVHCALWRDGTATIVESTTSLPAWTPTNADAPVDEDGCIDGDAKIVKIA